MNIILSKAGNHLLFIDSSYDEHGIQDKNIIGALAIDPEGDKKKILAYAKKQSWEFEGDADINGFTKVVRA